MLGRRSRRHRGYDQQSLCRELGVARTRQNLATLETVITVSLAEANARSSEVVNSVAIQHEEVTVTVRGHR